MRECVITVAFKSLTECVCVYNVDEDTKDIFIYTVCVCVCVCICVYTCNDYCIDAGM